MMRGCRFLGLSVSTLVLVTGLTGWTSPAFGAAVIEEILVTARKREESIQEIPVAVTAVSGEQFDRAVIFNFEEASALTPGFTTNASGHSPLAYSYAIRGSVQNSVLITDDPSVGVYVDGAYVARPWGIGVDLLDLNDLQVLKGPQGTLFGRNSTAGAVLLRTNDAELGEFEADVGITYGPDYAKGSIVVNIPLGDQIAIRGAYQKSDRDNYIDNIANNPNNPLYTQFNAPVVPGAMYTIAKDYDSELGGTERETWRIKARWSPIESLDFQVSYEEFEADVDGPARETLWLAGATTGADEDDDSTSLSFDPRTFADTKTWIVNATWDSPIGEFKVIYANREYRNLNEADYDGGDYAAPPIDFSAVFGRPPGTIVSYRRHGSWGRTGGDQDSVEAQLNGSAFDDKLDFSVGVLYFDEYSVYYDYAYGFNPYETLAAGGGVTAGGNWVAQDTTSWGYYAQGTYHLTDRLNLTAGVRYTDDEKTGHIVGSSATTRSNVAPIWDFDAYRAMLTGDTTLREPKETWNSTDWLVSVDYLITDDVMVYGKVSTGFRSGGFNGRGPSTPNTNLVFDPEELTEYEVGLKADFLDGTVRWNTAVYTNETKDKQFTVLVTPETVGAAPGTTTENAGKAEATGFETELTYLVNENWTLVASWGYVDSKIKELIAYDEVTQTVGPIPDDRLPRVSFVPENEFTLGVNYDQDFSSFRVSGTVMYHWIDEMYQQADAPAQKALESSFTLQQTTEWADTVTSDSRGIVNASITFGSLDDRYSLTVWGRNVLDERAKQACVGFINGAFYQYGQCTYTEPSTFGVTLDVSF